MDEKWMADQRRRAEKLCEEVSNLINSMYHASAIEHNPYVLINPSETSQGGTKAEQVEKKDNREEMGFQLKLDINNRIQKIYELANDLRKSIPLKEDPNQKHSTKPHSSIIPRIQFEDAEERRAPEFTGATTKENADMDLDGYEKLTQSSLGRPRERRKLSSNPKSHEFASIESQRTNLPTIQILGDFGKNKNGDSKFADDVMKNVTRLDVSEVFRDCENLELSASSSPERGKMSNDPANPNVKQRVSPRLCKTPLKTSHEHSSPSKLGLSVRTDLTAGIHGARPKTTPTSARLKTSPTNARPETSPTSVWSKVPSKPGLQVRGNQSPPTYRSSTSPHSSNATGSPSLPRGRLVWAACGTSPKPASPEKVKTTSKVVTKSDRGVKAGQLPTPRVAGKPDTREESTPYSTSSRQGLNFSAKASVRKVKSFPISKQSDGDDRKVPKADVLSNEKLQISVFSKVGKSVAVSVKGSEAKETVVKNLGIQIGSGSSQKCGIEANKTKRTNPRLHISPAASSSKVCAWKKVPVTRSASADNRHDRAAVSAIKTKDPKSIQVGQSWEKVHIATYEPKGNIPQNPTTFPEVGGSSNIKGSEGCSKETTSTDNQKEKLKKVSCGPLLNVASDPFQPDMDGYVETTARRAISPTIKEDSHISQESATENAIPAAELLSKATGFSD